MRATVYRIDGENQAFKTLRDAKDHIWFAYTPKERVKCFRNASCYIAGINENNGEVVSLTEIKVDENGKESFGKTKRY